METITLAPTSAAYSVAMGHERFSERLAGAHSFTRSGQFNHARRVDVKWVTGISGFEYLRATYRRVLALGCPPMWVTLLLDTVTPQTHQAKFISGSMRLASVDGNRYTVTAQVWAMPAQKPGNPYDPLYDQVVLLLHGNGENGGTVFTDDSQYEHVPTSIFGNVQTTTAVSRYNGSSVGGGLNQASGDYFQYAPSSEFAVGGQDFTLESLARRATINANSGTVYHARATPQTDAMLALWWIQSTNTSVQSQVRLSDGNSRTLSASVLAAEWVAGYLGTGWNHIFVSRQGNDIFLGANGFIIDTDTLGGLDIQNLDLSGSGSIKIGRDPGRDTNGYDRDLRGYFAETRLTIGPQGCRYSGNLGASYTVPNTPFPDSD